MIDLTATCSRVRAIQLVFGELGLKTDSGPWHAEAFLNDDYFNSLGKL